MDKGVYLAVSSIKADRLRQQNQAHEMSNISTIGFKKAFQVQQSTYRVDVDGSLSSRFFKVSVGLGRVDLTPGPRIFTQNPLDIYLEGKGVLGVFNQNGELAFTRRGDLRINAEGTLTNGNGFVIADEGGGDIQFDPALIHRISSEGVIYASDPEEEVAEEVEVGRLLLRNADGIALEKMKDGLLKVEEADGPGDFAGADEPVYVSSHGLEGSAVKSYDVLTRMIEIERGYEMKINIIKELSDLSANAQSLMQVN